MWPKLKIGASMTRQAAAYAAATAVMIPVRRQITGAPVYATSGRTAFSCTLRAPTMAPRARLRELFLVFVGFTAAALVMTLPLWQHPTRRLPSDLVDTLLNTWILGWDADRLRHALRGWWDAPAFFPYRNTLAFSETLLGIAIFVGPIDWITHNPV